MIDKNGVMTDAEIEGLRRRNEARAAAVIESMGTRYTCHPVHVLRKNPAKAHFKTDAKKTVQSVVSLRRKGA